MKEKKERNYYYLYRTNKPMMATKDSLDIFAKNGVQDRLCINRLICLEKKYPEKNWKLSQKFNEFIVELYKMLDEHAEMIGFPFKKSK